MKKHASGLALFFILNSAFPMPARQSIGHPEQDRNSGATAAWAEYGRDMQNMQSEMMSIEQSGSSDMDFTRLMLPHHQAAIDMAKTELLYGQDPQMRRLAQEIITDQQSEIELMRLWLKQHKSISPK
jgi:uncharacterized protein (DUF305 family)